jgi:hypothetical protein
MTSRTITLGCNHEPRNRRAKAFITGTALVAALAWAAGHSQTANAKDVDVYLWYSKAPTIYVEAQNGAYAVLSPEKHTSPYIAFEADIDILGGQDRIREWNFAPRMKALGQSWGWTFGTPRPPEQGWGVVRQSYGLGDRPKTVRQHIVMLAARDFVQNFAVNVCNANVSALRNQGKSNHEIFGSDRSINVHTGHKSQVTYTNIADNDNSQVHESEGSPQKQATIVCMKTNPQRVQPPQNYEAPVTVTQTSLTLIEKATANGACKVILSGVVQTNLANRDVKFRYEHSAGHKSEIKTIRVDHSKTAFFSHEYDIPNNERGNETGMIRFKGTEPNFESAWKSYSMNCGPKAPGGLQSAGGNGMPANPPRAQSLAPATINPTAASLNPALRGVPQRAKTP